MGKPQAKLRSDRKDDYYNFNLRNARINAGLTQRDLGKEIGRSYSAVSSYERLRCTPLEIFGHEISHTLFQKQTDIFSEEIRSIAAEVRAERRAEDRKAPFKVISIDELKKRLYSEENQLKKSKMFWTL